MLRSRVITALALSLLLVGAILYAPAYVTAAVLGAILLIGSWEWSAFLDIALPGRLAYTAVLLGLGWFGKEMTLPPDHFEQMLELAVAWWIVALAWVVIAPQRGGRIVAALAGALTLLPTWVALVRIDAHWDAGPAWTLFILALAFAADTGAFFAGRAFGRSRLAPAVSPNKTWEGVIGGMLLVLALAAGGTRWFMLPARNFLPLCLAAGAFSVVGDLTESMLKRHVRLKDSGRLFPGHGGALDRIDSVTAATPIVALGLVWMGVGT